MSVEDCIIGLYIRIDAVMKDEPKHPQANLYPSEVVTLAVLYALKGRKQRAFYRWLSANYRGFFPSLPERTRLFRLFAAHQHWADAFLAQPTTMGVADSYGIELIHPMREDRSGWQIGRKGLSDHRWIVGAKFAYLLNQYGLVVAWESADAGMADNGFAPLIEEFADEMVIFTDTGFHSKDGDPPNQKVCKRGTWNNRMMVETVLSMLTDRCGLKKVSERSWAGLNARLAFTMALFNIAVLWDGLIVDDAGMIHFTMAQFSL